MPKMWEVESQGQCLQIEGGKNTTPPKKNNNTLPRVQYKSKYDQRRHDENIHAVDNNTDYRDYDEVEFHTIKNSNSCTEFTTKIKI